MAYADDIAAVISARDIEKAERKLRQVMNRTQTWLAFDGINLASQKTELLLLTKRHRPTEISLNVDEITPQSTQCLNYLH